jgi:exodeoxyribonuclease V beta subunit
MSATTWDLSSSRVIEASAGTGKTFTIETLVCRLVAEGGMDISQLLVTTYTDAAAAELRDRIRRRLAVVASALRGSGSDALVSEWQKAGAPLEAMKGLVDAALHNLDRACISTIHSFCRKTLGELPFESGADIGRTLVQDAAQVEESALADAWAAVVADLPADQLAVLDHAVTPEVALKLVATVLAHPDLPIEPSQAESTVPSGDWLKAAVAEAEEVISALGLGAVADWMQASRKVTKAFRALVEPQQDATLGAKWARMKALLDVLATEGAEKCESAVPAKHSAHKREILQKFERLLRLRADLLSRFDAFALCVRVQLAEFARRSAVARKQRERTLTFDDMLHDVRRALDGPSAGALVAAMRHRYRAVLVDEFQDTDRVQSEIFKKLFGGEGARIYFIGDPKQSIYLFRGADLDAYMAATRPPAFVGERSDLGKSYRTDRPLLDAVQALVEFEEGGPLAGIVGDMPDVAAPRLAAHHQESRLHDRQGKGVSAVRVLHTADDAPEAGGTAPRLRAGVLYARVAEGVREELSAGLTIPDPRTGLRRPVVPGDIAILFLGNRDLERMQEELRQRGIASVLRSRMTVWESQEAQDLERILCAIGSPERLSLRRAAACTEFAGFHSEEVRDLGKQDSDPCIGHLTEWLLSVGRELEMHGPVPMVRHMLDVRCTPEREPARLRLLSRAGGERSVSNAQHVAELLSGYWRSGVRSASELAARIAAARGDGASDSEQNKSILQRVESDDGGAVTLLTLHRSKGLEWPIVWVPAYCVGKWMPKDDRSGAFPTTVGGRRVLAVGGPAHQQAGDALCDEERRQSFRLLYVALTRARHRCNLVWGPTYQQANKRTPLAALFHGRAANSMEDAELQAGIALRNPASVVADLDAYAQRARSDGLEGVVEVTPLPGRLVTQWKSVQPSTVLSNARVLARALPSAERTTSFTGLTRGAHEHRSAMDAAEEPRVRSDDAARDETAAAHADAAMPLMARSVLPAGPAYGDLVHRILETGLWTIQTESFVQLVESACRQVSMPGDAKALALGLRSVSEQRLLAGMERGVDTGAASLQDLVAGTWRAELSYLLPAGRRATGQGAERRVSVADLARVFEGGDAVAQRYAEHARNLTAPEFRGHLVGFIDLICQHQEKWYVLDYKTNALGVSAEEFSPKRLEVAMMESHYVLQYHLYALAIHRWLRTRIPNYDYDRHFGGALYLFVRPMGRDRPAGSGVFADRPSRALIGALDALIAGEGAP